MSKSFEIEGSIRKIFDAQSFPSGFTKREFVVTEDDERYPQDIKFTVTKERCATLDNFREGQKVKVTFSLRGNEYKEKYYVDLNAFKVEQLNDDGGTTEFDPLPPGDGVDMIPEDDPMPF